MVQFTKSPLLTNMWQIVSDLQYGKSRKVEKKKIVLPIKKKYRNAGIKGVRLAVPQAAQIERERKRCSRQVLPLHNLPFLYTTSDNVPVKCTTLLERAFCSDYVYRLYTAPLYYMSKFSKSQQCNQSTEMQLKQQKSLHTS